MFVSAADLSDAVEQVTRLGARLLLQLLQDLCRQLLEPPAPLHRHAPPHQAATAAAAAGAAAVA